jgi:hypothetical protein
MENENKEDNIVSGETVTKIVNTQDNAYPIDVSALRKRQEQVSFITLENNLSNISVRKPKKQEFFRVIDKPGCTLETSILEVDSIEREYYLVETSLHASLEDELTPVILHLCINRQGELFFWPVKSHASDGRRNKWTESALEAAKLAKEKWIRIMANMSKGEYDLVVAEGAIPAPDWPDITFDKLINIAFKGQYITDLDHVVLKKLRGEI